MNNVFQLFIKYGYHLIFIILECTCLYFIVNYNRVQNEIFWNSSNVYIAKIATATNRVNQYLNVRTVNDSLQRENANLIENLIRIEYINKEIPLLDSIFSQYSIIPATICNNTFHLTNNHLTLCKGRREGIEPNMGVISDKGIIGIVRNVSDNYAHVVSILHSQTRVSCAIKSRNTHGNLIWKTFDPQRMTLESIPKHQYISKGDTIITSGYSTIFPRGILIGQIESFEVVPGSNSYEITVKLFKNISSLQYAYVIKNSFSAEQLKLEQEISNE
ncbi:MAG: rod shape-determining protein MreC [Saprospiraceae bacterium]